MSLTDINQITLDLSVRRIVHIRCKKDDSNSRKVLITITNDGKPFTISSSTSINYKIHKADGTVIYNPVDEMFAAVDMIPQSIFAGTLFDEIREDGKVFIDLTDQCVAFSGISQSELQLLYNGQVISTMPFGIIVEESVVNNKDIESSSEFGTLVEYISKEQEWKEKVENLTNEIIVDTGVELPSYLRTGDFYLQEY